MQYHAFCSSSCSGQGYKKIPVSVLKRTTRTCIFGFSRFPRKLNFRGRPVSLEKLFVQEARRSRVCLTKMAQGRWPAFCCLSEECLLSGKKRSRQLKVTLDLQETTAVAQDPSLPLLGQVWSQLLESALLTKSSGVCPWKQSSVSQIQSWQHHREDVCF